MFYTTPPGFIDQPYFWALDTADVPNGGNANLAINLPGGFDFLLRRFTGVQTVVDPASTSSGFNFLYNNKQGFASATLRNPAKLRDRLIIPEAFYPQTGGINFSLENTLCAFITDPANGQTIEYGQMCFQGARRRQGSVQVNDSRKFRRIPYHKECAMNINFSYFGNRQRQFSFEVDDFDLEAHAIYWTFDTPGFDFVDWEGIVPTSIRVNGAVASTVVLDLQSNAPNPTLTVSVSGNTVTVQMVNLGLGTLTTAQELIDAVNGNSAAAALMTLSLWSGNPASSAIPPTTLTLSNWQLNRTFTSASGQYGPIAKFCLYDYAGNGLMPNPILIDYLNEPIPFGSVRNQKSGALYPILIYPKDSAIRVDMVSMLRTGVTVNAKMNILGMQRIPV